MQESRGADIGPSSSPHTLSEKLLHTSKWRPAAALFGAVLLLGLPCQTAAFGAGSSDGATSAEEFFWSVVKDSHTTAPFSIYLQQYPQGRHRAEAEARIHDLTTAPAPAPPPEATPAATDAAPAASLAPAQAPAADGKPARGVFYARSAAQVRADPDSNARIVRSVDGREPLHVNYESADGKWYRFGGARGGWVEAASVIDAKTAEAEAWARASRSSRNEDLQRYLLQFPKGQHADDARALLATRAPPPARQAAAPQVSPALEAVISRLREEIQAPANDARPDARDASGSTKPPAPGPERDASLPPIPGDGAVQQEALLPPDQGPPPVTSVLPHGDFMERYNAALGAIAEGQSKLGEERLKALIADFPSDPMVPNVHYRLGDLYFDQHDYARAVDELRSAYSSSASGPSAPRALYEIAVSAGYGGDAKDACSQLESLERKYPGISEDLEDQVRLARAEFRCGIDAGKQRRR